MDWRLMVTTFVTIFIAEIGDKTQLTTLSFASGGNSRLQVFLAAALALITATGVAVLAGEALSRIISPLMLKRGAGLLFIILGIVFLADTWRSPSPPPAASTQASAALRHTTRV